MNSPQKGTVWQHRKGGTYAVDRVATHTETGERLVVYTGQDGQSWARPESQFMDGRFSPVSDPDTVSKLFLINLFSR